MKQQVRNIRVGIVGEHPNNDALALSHLLKSVAHENVDFIVLQKNNRGSHLDSMKFFRTLRAEFRSENPHFIILVRDLDGLTSSLDKITERDSWFVKANKEINNCDIFFLVIYEMEALILADIDNFNKYYKLKVKPIGNPTSLEKPKEYLQKLTEKTQKGKYEENDAPKIIQSLNFKTIYSTHNGERSFQHFADELIKKNLIKL